MTNINYANNLELALVHLLDSEGCFYEPNSGVVPSRLVLADRKSGVYLYQANCLEIMDLIIEKYPQGCFDMISADPPYFLSNGGFTCQAGKMVKVHKGDWDKSNATFN